MGGRSKSEAEKEFNGRVGQLIERARMNACLEQLELAAHLGVTRSQIYSYESGRSQCSIFRLIKISEICRVPLKVLIPNCKQNTTYSGFPGELCFGGSESC